MYSTRIYSTLSCSSYVMFLCDSVLMPFILSSDIQRCEGGATHTVQLCCRKNVEKGRKCKSSDD